jgi:hypothetical protein
MVQHDPGGTRRSERQFQQWYNHFCISLLKQRKKLTELMQTTVMKEAAGIYRRLSICPFSELPQLSYLDDETNPRQFRE